MASGQFTGEGSWLTIHHRRQLGVRKRIGFRAAAIQAEFLVAKTSTVALQCLGWPTMGA